MNLRLSSKGARVRLNREELALLEGGHCLEEHVSLPGGGRFSWSVRRQDASAPPVTAERQFELQIQDEELRRLARTGELALMEAVVEIDAFSGERRARKEKRDGQVLAADDSR